MDRSADEARSDADGAPKLLIVDDESKLLDTLRTFFEQRGYLVWAVATGEAALQVMSEHRPDVALLDMCLDGSRLQGFDVLRLIKAQSPDIVVLMCSGSADEEKKAEALNLGAEEFFEKPVNLTELLRAIQAANGRRKP